jgi:hypothetical protein
MMILCRSQAIAYLRLLLLLFVTAVEKAASYRPINWGEFRRKRFEGMFFMPPFL